MGSRLCLLNKHDAILLLRHCIATPRVLYTLRTAPCFRSPCLEELTLSFVPSSALSLTSLDNNLVWSQATSPVRNGGIRVCRATQLAPSTFLASAAVETLLSAATEPRTRARLLAAATSESGSWLNAVPASSLGFRMDDDVLRIAIGVRLGPPLCRPHACQLCSASVDERQFMVSVASGVLDVNHAMLQLMMSSRELCHQPRSPPCWNPPASVGLTASDLMG